MTDTISSPRSRTLRRCGCTPGACVTCAPRGGCPCHELAALLEREPYPAELAAVLPSPPYRRPTLAPWDVPPTVTYCVAPWVPARDAPALEAPVLRTWSDEEAPSPPAATLAPAGGATGSPALPPTPKPRRRAPRGARQPPRAG